MWKRYERMYKEERIDLDDVVGVLGKKPQYEDMDIKLLLKVSRKFEIAPTVYKFYDKESWRPFTSKGVMLPGEIAKWLDVFLKAYDQTKDLRFLNTVLKVLDRKLIAEAEAQEVRIRARVNALIYEVSNDHC